MKVLYVEDNEDFAQDFAEFLDRSIPTADLRVVESSGQAEAALPENDFDVVIVDLAIPPEPGGEPRVETGAAFCRKLASDYSAALIIIFTGQYDERETHELRDEMRRNVCYCGGAERPLLSRKRKDDIENIVNMLTQLVVEEQVTSAITLSSFATRRLGTECPEPDRRLLRAFCASRGGSSGRVEKLSGGLSGNAVYRLDVVSQGGVTTQRCVAKLADGLGVDREIANYDRYVSQLPIGSCAQRINIDLVAGGGRRAVFYSLAEGFNHNLFDYLSTGGDLVRLARQKLEYWHQDRVRRVRMLRQIVVSVGGERALEALQGLDIEGLNEVLNIEITVEEGTQHGDLHGANVLCDDRGENCCFIDFGDVARQPVCLDPITLELGPFFHPLVDATQFQPLKENPERWFDNDFVLSTMADGSWIHATRDWSERLALSHVDYAAVVLAYAARQLKYEDTDHKFATGIIRASLLQIVDR